MIVRQNVRGSAGLCRGVIPFDLQQFAPFGRAPVITCYHGDAGVDGKDIDHASTGQCGSSVEGTHLATEAGGVNDDGRQHAGQLDVLRVDRRAVVLAGVLALSVIAADQGELIRRLQGQCVHVRRALLRSRRGQVAKGGGMGAVRDNAAGHADLTGRHTPLRGRCVHQHGSGGRASLAHLHEAVGNGGAAAGALLTHQQIGVFLGVHRGVLAHHLGPVGIQLVGDAGGQAGVDALTHLKVLDHHLDDVVWCNADEGIELECSIGGALCLGSNATKVDTEHQSGRGAGRDFQETATAGINVVGFQESGQVHYAAPPAFLSWVAAMWMPALMRE
jgi:hypothetical protein